MAILNLKFMWDTRVKKIQHEAIANVGPDIRSLGEDLGLEMWIQCWLHVSDSRGDEASRGSVKRETMRAPRILRNTNAEGLSGKRGTFEVKLMNSQR